MSPPKTIDSFLDILTLLGKNCTAHFLPFTSPISEQRKYRKPWGLQSVQLTSALWLQRRCDEHTHTKPRTENKNCNFHCLDGDCIIKYKWGKSQSSACRKHSTAAAVTSIDSVSKQEDNFTTIYASSQVAGLFFLPRSKY